MMQRDRYYDDAKIVWLLFLAFLVGFCYWMGNRIYFWVILKGEKCLQ